MEQYLSPLAFSSRLRTTVDATEACLSQEEIESEAAYKRATRRRVLPHARLPFYAFGVEVARVDAASVRSGHLA